MRSISGWNDWKKERKCAKMYILAIRSAKVTRRYAETTVYVAVYHLILKSIYHRNLRAIYYSFSDMSNMARAHIWEQ
jgi:hypothetical protein